METLPEEADADAYAAMPIAEFGAAMMRGMGWTEGQGVGRRQAGPATPFQYVQRPHRLGLGAQPAAREVLPCLPLPVCLRCPSVRRFTLNSNARLSGSIPLLAM